MTARALSGPFLLSLACGAAFAQEPADNASAARAPEAVVAAADQATPTQASVAATPETAADVAAPASMPSPTPRVSVLADARNADAPPAPPARPRAFEYSDAYQTRLKIHRYASYATLPLFIAQYAVGQKLYNGTGSNSTRTVHSALAVGTGALFGLNTVTGVWNLSEGHKDPNRRTKKTVHSILMLAADGGFAATGLLAPHLHHRDGSTSGVSPATHRGIAIGSMGVAVVSYAIMLFH